jgi:hypothetical protein
LIDVWSIAFHYSLAMFGHPASKYGHCHVQEAVVISFRADWSSLLSTRRPQTQACHYWSGIFSLNSNIIVKAGASSQFRITIVELLSQLRMLGIRAAATLESGEDIR